MTSRDFCFWLQGFFELRAPSQDTGLSLEQSQTVQRHLALVFAHEIDPSMGPPKAQQALNAIHGHPPGPGGPVMRC